VEAFHFFTHGGYRVPRRGDGFLPNFFQKETSMLHINGTLTVKKINGAKGAFSVGDLVTDVGTFKVKDALLDQFEEGRYQGEFAISSIYLSSYIWRGKAMTDIRANLVDVQLDEVGMAAPEPSFPQSSTQDEPDPIEEEEAARPQAARSAEPATDTTVVVVTPSGQVDVDPALAALVKLFGAELGAKVWKREGVKLDPTVDRGLFREQRDKLKELGYRFDPRVQAWAMDSDA
jgi:hypothetical protein